MSVGYTFLLPSTLVIFGTGFFIIWQIWRSRPALFWGMAYILWAACQFLQAANHQFQGINLAPLAQALFLSSIFFQMHGLQDLAGEPNVAFRSRVAICLVTIGLTSWMVFLSGVDWAVLSIRLAMRLAFTVIALTVMWRHMGRAINKILFAVVVVMTISTVLVASGMIYTSQVPIRSLIYDQFVIFGQVSANVFTIAFALSVLGTVVSDFTQRYRAEALHDSLSGLPNRRQFDAFHLAEWRRAADSRQYLSLVMIDVDMFKAYNDTYGHAAGDRCLVRVAEAIQSCVRQRNDLCARLGGEEFVAILPGTTAAGAAIVAENICEAVRSAAIPHERSPFGVVTVSAGVAAAVPAGNHDGTLFEAADASLYRAKANGRNRVEMTL
jgi:diguanylate cyclase (GGDEF)-like protein